MNRALFIDTSHWEGVINPTPLIARGIKLAIFKLTESTWYIDDKFIINATAWLKEGGQVGAYHFFRPGSDCLRQAAFFLDVLEGTGLQNEISLVMNDMEVTDGISPATRIPEWVDRWNVAVMGETKLPLWLYSARWFFDQMKAALTPLLKYDLVTASYYWDNKNPFDQNAAIAYATNPDNVGPSVTPWPKWNGWQFTARFMDKAATSAAMDLNAFWNDQETLDKLFKTPTQPQSWQKELNTWLRAQGYTGQEIPE